MQWIFSSFPVEIPAGDYNFISILGQYAKGFTLHLSAAWRHLVPTTGNSVYRLFTHRGDPHPRQIQ